jgi:protein TonB
MFETAVIRAQTQAPERRAGLLTASVAAHTLAVSALIIASIQSLRLPTHAPNQMTAFVPVVVMPPIQSGVAHGSTAVTHPPTQQPTPRTVTAPADAAPRVIPDQTPTVTSSSTSTGSEGPAASGPERIGVPDGLDIGGIPPVGDVPSQPAVAEPRIYHVSEVNPPVVVTRVMPEFPRMAQMAHKSGWAIVECVIDSNGHIRDAHVTGSSWDVFDKPALDAVQQWMFKPGSLNGQAVNTLFELRVTFTLH